MTRGKSMTTGSELKRSASAFCRFLKSSRATFSTFQYACHRLGLLSTMAVGGSSNCVTGSRGLPSEINEYRSDSNHVGLRATLEIRRIDCDKYSSSALLQRHQAVGVSF